MLLGNRLKAVLLLHPGGAKCGGMEETSGPVHSQLSAAMPRVRTGAGSTVEHLSHMCEAQGLAPGIANIKKQRKTKTKQNHLQQSANMNLWIDSEPVSITRAGVESSEAYWCKASKQTGNTRNHYTAVRGRGGLMGPRQAEQSLPLQPTHH